MDTENRLTAVTEGKAGWEFGEECQRIKQRKKIRHRQQYCNYQGKMGVRVIEEGKAGIDGDRRSKIIL